MKAVIVVILLVMAGYLGYRILSKPKAADTTVVKTEPTVPATAAPPVVVERKAASATNPTNPANTNKLVARVKDAGTQSAKLSTKPAGEWKAKMELILGSNASAQQKVQDLKEMLAKLEEEEAEQAVHELTTRVKDEGYAFLKPLAVDPGLPEAARDQFMVDMLNRPNAIKLPLFLEIARNPDHPDHESAFDNLEIFTGLKYGADWNGWEKGIQQWLRENPELPRPNPLPVPPQVN